MKNSSKEMTFRANERFVFIPIFGVLEAYPVEVKEYKSLTPLSVGGCAGEAGKLEVKCDNTEGCEDHLVI